MSEAALNACKIALALAACTLLWWESARARRWHAALRRRVRAGYWLLALLAAGAYFHFGALPYKGFYHRWEMFHYYLGSRYFDELGYKRLYRCVAIADAESGNAERVARRRLRDLETDALIDSAGVLAAPELCKSHFTPARWAAFRGDVVWFRTAAAAPDWWDAMQQDHGYNPPPLWTLIGRSLSSLAPPSDTWLKALGALDVALMAGCIAALGWGFGARVAALAAVFWGTQAASDFMWTGGAFLRQDWLFCAVLSAALLRRRQPFAAGVALAAAGLLRVFPLLFWAGPVAVIASTALRRRRWPRWGVRFVQGGALALVVLTLGTLRVAGATEYREFGQRLGIRAEVPITNHMSLRTLFSVSPGARLDRLADASAVDPGARWAAARRAHLAELRPLYWLAAALLGGLCLLAALQVQASWAALAISVALLPLVSDPSCYYYSAFVLIAPLCRVRRELALPWIALAAGGQLLTRAVADYELRYAALAGIYVLFGFALALAIVRSRPRRTLSSLFGFKKEGIDHVASKLA